MSRQNRVTPTGALIATSARGTLMGNRGCLHDAAGDIRRSFQLQRWIICVLAFKGRQRRVMTPGHYTELFFLDEATAFAAGHRPCAECQRERFTRFKQCWAQAHAVPYPPLRADAIDTVLHSQRLDAQRRQQTHDAPLASLPDGAFMRRGDQPALVWQGRLYPWTPDGYTSAEPLPETDAPITVLTPPALVAVLRAGYPIGVHATVSAAAAEAGAEAD